MEDACTDSLASIPELEHKVDTVSNEDTPPNTVLVRWKGELLLLDAWNVTGTKLRTPPSLIDEALKHFQMEKHNTVDQFRLAVQDLVDDRPALLYLGLTALRFIENGRVLELIDLSEHKAFRAASSPTSSPAPKYDESATETYDTAPLPDDRSDTSSDLSTSTSPTLSHTSRDSCSMSGSRECGNKNPKFYIEGRRRPRRTPNSCDSRDRPPVFIANHVRTVLCADAEDTSPPSTSVYVDQEQGAVFRRDTSQGHRAGHSDISSANRKKEITAWIEDSSRAEQIAPPSPADEVTYDFRDQKTLPRPTLSHPSTPLLKEPSLAGLPAERSLPSSRPPSRNSSLASNMSRTAGRPARPKKSDDDPWLSSESTEQWKHVRLPRNTTSQRNRSFDRLGLASINENYPEDNKKFRLPRSQSHSGFRSMKPPDQRSHYSER